MAGKVIITCALTGSGHTPSMSPYLPYTVGDVIGQGAAAAEAGAAVLHLGFGLQPPAASWGLMINENRVGLIANPWGVLMPAILIALFTIGVNTFTDVVTRASLGVGRRSTEPDPLVDLAVEGATT